jgi:DNA polymerase III delta prime subunit
MLQLSDTASRLVVSHHAFRVNASSREVFLEFLHSVQQELQSRNYAVDAWHRTYDTLTIGDKSKGERFVQDICDRVYDAVNMPEVGPQASQAVRPLRLVAIWAARITSDAQNMLLKTLEEPPATTKIIIATPSPSSLLPTILSRTILLENNAGMSEANVSVPAETLCGKTKAERLKSLEEIVEAKDVGAARRVLHELMQCVEVSSMTHAERSTAQQRLLALDRELEGGAPMMKMVLEAAVLLVP